VLILETITVLHAGPFDRMLLAQASRSSMPLLTIDEDLRRYTKVKIRRRQDLPGKRPKSSGKLLPG
jgi:hypothetical protein